MDAKVLQKVYVSLLYSDKYKIPNAEKEYEYLSSTMDNERLKIERAARRRNLRTVLYSDMHFSPRFFSKEEFLDLVIDYCESDSFWNWNSRTLVESFCYFVCHSSALSEQDKVIFLLDGIYSGISTGLESSPWDSSVTKRHADSLTEEIASEWYLPLVNLNKVSDLDDLGFVSKPTHLRFHNENGKVALSCREAA